MRHRKPENFLAALSRNGHGIAEEERLTATQAADEALVMGLRLTEGIDADALATRFELPAIVEWRAVDRLTRSGHLTRLGSHVAATAAGRLVLNRVLAEIAA